MEVDPGQKNKTCSLTWIFYEIHAILSDLWGFPLRLLPCLSVCVRSCFTSIWPYCPCPVLTRHHLNLPFSKMTAKNHVPLKVFWSLKFSLEKRTHFISNFSWNNEQTNTPTIHHNGQTPCFSYYKPPMCFFSRKKNLFFFKKTKN